MKYFILLVIISLTLIGCSNTLTGIDEDTYEELKDFMETYNEVADRNEFKLDKLTEEKIEDFKKMDDGDGYKLTLDEGGKDATTLRYNVRCIFDKDKNIIGYESFGMGNPKNIDMDGAVKFSDKGIQNGYAIAEVLNLNMDTFNMFYGKLMDDREEFIYKENDYEVIMKANGNIGSVSFEFLKTN
ncbi:hypothetical protein ABET51_04180 [Metabacillus fastidiosus]|uniref:hypothetical protein n=1 Tax=Metabacillus fastidiosus TaxID=1458 RepID=UPI002E1E716D|nr:hypothetical protein [Metabacillus fastidiosus]